MDMNDMDFLPPKHIAMPTHDGESYFAAFSNMDLHEVPADEPEEPWWSGVYSETGNELRQEQALLAACRAGDLSAVKALIGNDFQKR
jgi:hypothetical protein